ncbi:hypothetical protein NF556_16040 [Ornithinimicrobium faecis]|uniref:Tetratricopeptide repeat protein n=1 Tax=Ornithinimicrobium faecis TaxID=2934158 RepID=A0ABY4YRV7_9MICO|nr:hypothetical protein [Ornithinimicrobium sp. HY1793]USQ79113.1 hypothetical protein NF556_16040 [Ornithinimicrobium sp. HY1793]
MRSPIVTDDVFELYPHGPEETHQDLAEHLLALAADPHQDDEVTVGGLLVLAGEHLESAGNLTAAEDAFREAAAHRQDPKVPEPLTYLVDVLLEQDRRDEAVGIDDELQRSRPEDPNTYVAQAESWEHHGDLQRALGWVNRGLALDERTGAFHQSDVKMICQTRWRIRRALGFGADEYDQVAITIQETFSG